MDDETKQSTRTRLRRTGGRLEAIARLSEAQYPGSESTHQLEAAHR